MSKKQLKKDKKKFIKLKQKEITARNKALKKDVQNKIELLSLDKSELPDLEDKIERSGPRGYVLKILKDIIDDINLGCIDDKEIIPVAQLLIKFAEKPSEVYSELLDLANINLSKQQKKLMNKSNVSLNLTERVLLKNRMQGILMEYQFKDLSTANIDYSGIRVFFETAYRLILVGLEDRKILGIDIYLGYGDIIFDLIVEYDGENHSKYNINHNTFIYIGWKPLDNLYNTYTIYKNKFKNFSEGSVQSLATATDMGKEYESRNNGKELISYSGVVLNYICPFESELKNLISKKFNLDKDNLKLVKAINYLKKINNQLLSDEKTIDTLHKVRSLRNKVAHGKPATYDEYRYIYNSLLLSGILECLNKELANINNNIDDSVSTYREDVCFKNHDIKPGYEVVFNSLTIAAHKGDSESQTTLGALYMDGDIVKQDFQESAKWLTKAANKGRADAQTLLAGMYLFGQGFKQDDEKAAKWYSKAAEQGNAVAQGYLGNMYCLGRGVKQDTKKGIELLINSANQGNEEAQHALGEMYSSGQGVKQDIKEAVKWYLKAATKGYAKSQYTLGEIYSSGEGVKQDIKEAVKWYSKAAEQGDEDAQLSLGALYYNGDGVKADTKKGIRLFKKAAEQGNLNAQYLLGDIYSSGQGVKQDIKEAVKWYSKAAEQGDEDAQNRLDELKKQNMLSYQY